ncbi:MAG: site-specific integrase [Blautia sp.]|nr:site-specific integrase [Blautia sp.]MCM1202179.1 site-specific integrase [Bacteroides fragilis]
MSKRGENIYKRRDGRWEGRIRNAVYLRSGQKYRSVYGKTYGEVKRKLDEAKRGPLEENRCTVSMREAFHIWCGDKKGRWKESTYAAYRQTAEKHILPHLGEMSLCRINGPVMGAFLTQLQARNPELSDSYLSYICGIVQRIMTYMQRKTGMELAVPPNPAGAEKRARAVPPGDAELSVLEAYLLRNAGDGTCIGILAALHTGLRIGELCALAWEDIDLGSGILHVRNNIQRVKNYDGQKNKTELLLLPPKTVNSVRDIPIPPVLFRVLLACRKSGSGPLMIGPGGGFLDPRTLQYRFEKILKDCGITHFKFHMLRHAFATRCIEKGFDSKSLSEILGHSSIQITLNLYVHSTLQQKRRLMDLMDSYSDPAAL